MTTGTPTIHAIPVDDHDGTTTTLAEYRGDVLLVVNTASY